MALEKCIFFILKSQVLIEQISKNGLYFVTSCPHVFIQVTYFPIMPSCILYLTHFVIIIYRLRFEVWPKIPLLNVFSALEELFFLNFN